MFVETAVAFAPGVGTVALELPFEVLTDERVCVERVGVVRVAVGDELGGAEAAQCATPVLFGDGLQGVGEAVDGGGGAEGVDCGGVGGAVGEGKNGGDVEVRAFAEPIFLRRHE